ncbi:hypothetical protein StrepF001_09295 [Streptomyces sp. F001]|uniref:hypothetical protein n=1 Tax=Streptomyces sp. F001 TaxID=1510026 RepID=UPI00101E4AC7|nr:hypothetical protein [Streptomyces sp. F001]RZB19095.1 hypothetical protein StrepF001_09295 [Streptomyces sp. F001]
MPAKRSLTAFTGVVLLGLVLTACEDRALGTIEAREGTRSVQKISNPPVGGCHQFREGVAHVANYTLNDIILYQTADCTEPQGGESVYLPTQTSDDVVRSTGLWRSFTIVH